MQLTLTLHTLMSICTTHTHTLTNTEWEGDALEKRRTRILNMRKARNLGTHFPERVVWFFLSLFHIWTCSGHNTLLTHCTSMNCILWRSKKATTAHSHQGKHLPVIPQMTYITTKTLSEKHCTEQTAGGDHAKLKNVLRGKNPKQQSKLKTPVSNLLLLYHAQVCIQ